MTPDLITKNNTRSSCADEFNQQTIAILEMIAIGEQTATIYDAIALLYESRHPGMRCSMLELKNGKLLHGGAPSLPKAYCEAVHGLEYGPEVGSCGTATYTGKRCIVENIETDPKWVKIKHVALPHGMRCCWSEPIRNSDGKVLGAFGMYYNYPASPNQEESKDLISAARLVGLVMERDHNQKRIRELAYVDSLTKLASRGYFFQYMQGLISTSKRHNRTFSLLYIDLDDFKNINDSQGHDAGDTLLREIAERLTESCRDIDFIARLGGDEFCVITETTNNRTDAANAAQRCLCKLSQPTLIDGIEHTPTSSIGIAQFPTNGKTIALLLKAADTALYAAKSLGKNRFEFYETELTKQAEYKFRFEQLVRDAISKEKLTLVYQPKISLFTGEIIGIEALSRWNNSELGEVPPIEFIKVAERIGLITELTEWVLYTACKQTVAWQKEGINVGQISVNISPSLFITENFVELVKSVLKDTRLNPALLELEVTENVTQTSPENLSAFKELKALGISLALDDFGIGYSSFASLKHIKGATCSIKSTWLRCCPRIPL